jgi:hypothetical protein
MTNVILFPTCIRIGDWWWHAGRRYRNVAQLEASISEREYRRVYEWDCRRAWREFCMAESTEGTTAA